QQVTSLQEGSKFDCPSSESFRLSTFEASRRSILMVHGMLVEWWGRDEAWAPPNFVSGVELGKQGSQDAYQQGKCGYSTRVITGIVNSSGEALQAISLSKDPGRSGFDICSVSPVLKSATLFSGSFWRSPFTSDLERCAHVTQFRFRPPKEYIEDSPAVEPAMRNGLLSGVFWLPKRESRHHELSKRAAHMRGSTQ
ncbi:2432_t:CDS:2, partial [Acaulospora colombiana]